MTNRILIIEDEENIARVLQLELQFEGYKADMAHTGTDGLLKYREQQWDLILLDVMLPEMSGIDVLKRIRATESQTPVIMLTAKSEVEDKVKGLDLGANDYITKPFDIEELLARIRTALRFSQKGNLQHAQPTFGQLSMNEQTREVIYYGKELQLTPREYDLLLYLLKHPKQVLAREQILEAVWGYDYYGDTNVVDVYIRYVRQKLEAANDTPIIQTVRGVGYVLKEHKHET
ncbi:DNA-binding response regulator [Lysinibacillus sp. KCTC 33748]|uniref:response regulator transcription factor n=1 Tax=unclassified Lysinibacillus TaxID=2636778 RepID=UPI0009A5C609|nr:MULTISPECIES: response regulator transcription factor [unclassified Lysinibacillus]OXS70024.1 DNA-binding response regulator [Lysinibacillus sp. KCTC 33748]SKC06367.1 DNA-binding response regulator, OmpR family, contains REC and winged-helix (wHTH) domain [Lysinibacillus sp. AC-3]